MFQLAPFEAGMNILFSNLFYLENAFHLSFGFSFPLVSVG